MSLHSLPIVFLNLGGEMFYVLDQRLKTQRVHPDRCKKVLNDIASVMLNQHFLNLLFKPQKLYNDQALYTLFKDMAHTSIMKLNETSMGKLYDLMVMVFKYQICCASQPKDVVFITLNHLDSLKSIVTSPFVQKQIEVTYILLMKTYHSMRNSDLQRIRYDILNFFQDIHIKVSLFLRQGQQNEDGTFVIPLSNAIPYGEDMPGVIKLFDEDGMMKDIITFSPGGEYFPKKEKGCLDYKGNRGTQLGTSIYHDKTSPQDDFWLNATDLNYGRGDEPTTYRSELNTLVAELLGNIERKDEDVLYLDLFAAHESTNTDENNDHVKKMETLVLDDVGNDTHIALQSAATDVDIEVTGNGPPNVLDLLETTE